MPRSLSDIRAELRAAASGGHADALLLLADELHALGTSEAMATEANTRATVARMTGDLEGAIEYYREAVVLFEQLGDLKGAAHVCNNIGIVFRDMGDNPGALEYYHRSLGLYEDMDDHEGMAYVINNIGIVHHTSGNYPQALEHYHRALSVHEEMNDKRGIALVTGNIGVVHRATGSLDQAVEYYRRALAMYQDLDDRSGVASVTGNIGNLLVEQKQYEEALVHLRAALDMHCDLNDEARVARVTGNIGTALIQSGHVSAARSVVRDFLAMEVSDPGVRIDQLSLKAQLQIEDNEIAEAISTYQQALSVATEHQLRSNAAAIHLALRGLAQRTDNLTMYIEHNDAYTAITEEIRGKEATLAVAMQEKQREIKAMERERERERTVLYSTLPKHVADRMVRGEQVTDHYDDASVMFMDIVGFTAISDRIPPGHVILLLKAIFEVCDRVCNRYGLTKVKTIGDSYLAICTPDISHGDDGLDHHTAAALAARAMQQELRDLEVFIDPSFGDTSWTREIGDISVRIGLHHGPLVAGIVGTERLQYDVWGDTVNVASRMESTSEAGRIQVSGSFAQQLQSADVHSGTGPAVTGNSGRISELTLTPRGEIPIKGKGLMQTFWLE